MQETIEKETVRYNADLDEMMQGFYKDPRTEAMACLVWILLGMPRDLSRGK